MIAAAGSTVTKASTGSPPEVVETSKKLDTAAVLKSAATGFKTIPAFTSANKAAFNKSLAVVPEAAAKPTWKEVPPVIVVPLFVTTARNTRAP